MEPWRGREGGRADKAFLGEDLKAGLRDGGTRNPVRRSPVNQPCSRWERNSDQLRTPEAQRSPALLSTEGETEGRPWP